MNRKLTKSKFRKIHFLVKNGFILHLYSCYMKACLPLHSIYGCGTENRSTYFRCGAVNIYVKLLGEISVIVSIIFSHLSVSIRMAHRKNPPFSKAINESAQFLISSYDIKHCSEGAISADNSGEDKTYQV